MSSSTNKISAPRDTFSRRYYFTESRNTKTDLIGDMSTFLTEEGQVTIVDKVDRVLQEVSQSTSIDEHGFLFTKEGNRLTIEWSEGLSGLRSVSFGMDGAVFEDHIGLSSEQDVGSSKENAAKGTQPENFSVARGPNDQVPSATERTRVTVRSLLND